MFQYGIYTEVIFPLRLNPCFDGMRSSLGPDPAQ